MTFGFYAMGMVSAAVVQMMRSTKLLVTFFVSIKILERKQHFHHYVGVFVTFSGLFFVVLASLGHSKHHGKLEGHKDQAGFALFLCVCAEIMNSGLYLYQDVITKRYDVQPIELVGKMGIIGICLSAIALCVLNPLSLESTPKALEKLSDSGTLVVTILVYVLCAAMFELSSVSVSKEGSAVHRAMIDVSRSALIWGIELSLNWISFKILHLLGFILIITGTLVYNGLLTVPGLEPQCEDAPIKAKEEPLPSVLKKEG
jgi:drug/metabolite transporter (DMT)-like permease